MRTFSCLLPLASLLLALAAAAQPASPQDAPALFVDALASAFLGDHEAAIARYREVLEKAPDQPTVLAALADSYAATGAAALAQATADEAARLGADNPFFAAAAARIAAERGDFSGARARYESALATHPGTPLLLESLADLYEQHGAFTDAAARVAQLPDSPATRTRLLRLYHRAGDDAAFLCTYEKLARAGRPTPAQIALLAEHHAAMGREAEARAAYRLLLQRDPANAEARRALGEASVSDETPGLDAYRQGDFARAADELAAALDADAGTAERWAQAALAALEAGRPEAAARFVEDGRLIFFDAPPLVVAGIYEALARGDRAGARTLVDAAQQALENPDTPPLHRDALALARQYVLHAEGGPPAPAPSAELAAHALAPAPGGALTARLR